MGLLYHQYANTCPLSTHDSMPNSTFIIVALNIYELLIQLCNHIDVWNDNDTQEHCSHLRIIQLLAYNNYGEICYKVGKYDKYQHSMKNLQSHLQCFLLNLSRNHTEVFAMICNNLRLNAALATLFPGPALALAA